MNTPTLELLTTQPQRRPVALDPVTDLTIWEGRFQSWCRGQLPADLDWDRLLVAGGLVAGLLQLDWEEEDPEYEGADLDCWYYGLTQQEWEERVAAWMRALPEAEVAINTSRPIIELRTPQGPIFQLIHRPDLSSPRAVLDRFDMTHCMIGYDGTTLVLHPECEHLLHTGWTRVLSDCVLRRRVRKALARGWTVSMPTETRVQLTGPAVPGEESPGDYELERRPGPLFLSIWEDPEWVEVDAPYLVYPRDEHLWLADGAVRQVRSRLREACHRMHMLATGGGRRWICLTQHPQFCSECEAPLERAWMNSNRDLYCFRCLSRTGDLAWMEI